MTYVEFVIFAIVAVVSVAIVRPESLLYTIAAFMSLILAPYAIIIVLLMLTMAALLCVVIGVVLWELIASLFGRFITRT